jgi:hypothetical protein
MLRICAIVLTAYNCGYPGFAILRPAALERPLTSFHNEVNIALRQAMTGAEIAGGQIAVLAGIGTERAKRELAGDFSGGRKN